MIEEDFELILSSNIDWYSFSNKTILITGANGFLPAYMVEVLMGINKNKLINCPCKVIALVRNKAHAKDRFKKYLKDKNFVLLVQDVSNKIEVKNENIDFIIHAASLASPKYYNSNPLEVSFPNIFGTKNTLDLAFEHQVKSYLYFSSGEVYGELPDNTVIKEDSYGYLDFTSIRSCYGESKRMGENLCVSYGHQFGVPVKVARPFHTYGPGMKLDDGRVFSDFVKNIIFNENIEIKSDGSACRTFCYLADATIAFFKILLDGQNSQAYNVANSKEIITIKNLAIKLTKLFPEKKIEIIFAKQNKSYLQSPVKGNMVDTSKLKLLGWESITSLEEGFKKTIRSYSEY